MAVLSGKTGTVDGACKNIVSWECTINTELLPATSFCSSGWREFIEGLKGGSGSVVSNEKFTGSSSITLSNSEGGVSITGNVLWSEQSYTNEVDGILAYTNGFTFTGEVTVT